MANKASFFDRLTERIEIDEENYVVVQAPTYGEAQEIVKQAMKFNMKGGSNTPEAEIDIVEMEICSLVACITDWGGPGFAELRPNRKSILMLPQSVIEKIKPTVDKLSGSGKAEKKKSENTTS